MTSISQKNPNQEPESVKKVSATTEKVAMMVTSKNEQKVVVTSKDEPGIRVTDGKFKSKKIEVSAKATEDAFRAAINRVSPNKEGAIFLEISLRSPFLDAALNWLEDVSNKHAFKWHHGTKETTVYTNWHHPNRKDSIPPWCSELAGGGAVVMRRLEFARGSLEIGSKLDSLPTCRWLQFLFVFEKDLKKWKLVTGYGQSGETTLETSLRELKEEVGIKVDLSKSDENHFRLLGGHSSTRSRWPEMNDRYDLFGVTIPETTLASVEDKHEVLDVLWVSLAELQLLMTHGEHMNVREGGMPYERTIRLGKAAQERKDIQWSFTNPLALKQTVASASAASTTTTRITASATACASLRWKTEINPAQKEEYPIDISFVAVNRSIRYASMFYADVQWANYGQQMMHTMVGQDKITQFFL